MKLYRHNRSWKVAPLAIETDADQILKHLCKNIASFKKYGNDFMITSLDRCMLDPGGMYNTKIPHKKLMINGIEFDIQISRIGEVLICMRSSDEQIPGFKIIPNWRYFVVLKNETFDALYKELNDLEKSNEALHAELEDHLLRDKLKSDGHFI